MRILNRCRIWWTTTTFKFFYLCPMYGFRLLIALCCCVSAVCPSFSQADSVSREQLKWRRGTLVAGTGVLTAGSLVYLYDAWYSDYNSGGFHFFNDNKEWLQMDKAGHAFTTYQMARLMMDGFDWAGYSRSKKLFIGGGIGVAYMTAVEVMDGFSEGWGFSWGDQSANLLGASLAVSQEALWREQRVQLKYSYAESGLAPYNPTLLGNSFSTRILKDYNAQTIWLSVNLSTFMRSGTRFPRWLNVAVGYSAYGMLGGHANNFLVQDPAGNVLRFERERRMYLSLDVDLTRIKTGSRFLKALFSVVNILKFPAPALGISGAGLRFHPLYY